MLTTVMLIATLAAQPQQDLGAVKGWHGAEWGMTIEQLRTATGMELLPTDDRSRGTRACTQGAVGATLFRSTAAIQVRNDTSGIPNFCVSDTEGLTYVLLDFGTDTIAFGTVRNELVGSYGAPSSEERPTAMDRSMGVLMYTSTWVLPKTEIVLFSIEGGKLKSLTLAYSRRKPVL